jgi:anti-sigma factor RsiW
MAKCNEMGFRLGALVDDELESTARRQIESHLVGCATCLAQTADYATIGEELRKIVQIPQLEGFAKSVLEKIAKLAVIAFCVLSMRGGITALSASPSSLVDVRVDSIAAANPYLPEAVMVRRRHKQIGDGEPAAFRLPGGGMLSVRAHAIEDGRIAMQLIIHDRNGSSITTEVSMPAGVAFVLSGGESGRDTLTIRVRPVAGVPLHTAAKVDRRARRDG